MLRPLGTVLSKWSPARASLGEPLVAAITAWPELVGSRIADNAWPLALHGTTLVVATRSSAWSQQLQLLSPRILAGLAQAPETAHVERLTFRCGVLRRARAAAPVPARRAPAPRSAEPAPEPARDEFEALDRLRARIARALTGAAARCPSCGAPAERADSPCAPCAGIAERERRTEIARLLYAAPWLSFEEVRAYVPSCDANDFAGARRELLARWWEVLEAVRRRRRAPPDRHERQIASSYVLLQSGLPPERVTPAIFRNVLGEDLELALRAAPPDVDNSPAPKYGTR